MIFSILLLSLNGFAAEPEKWQSVQSAVFGEHNLDEIRALTASGTDPRAPVGCGAYAPLEAAITQDNLDMVAVLLSLGAKPTNTQMVESGSASELWAIKAVA